MKITAWAIIYTNPKSGFINICGVLPHYSNAIFDRKKEAMEYKRSVDVLKNDKLVKIKKITITI